MRDWNAVITVREGGFAPARRLLGQFGQVKKTDFFNTLIMAADDPFRLLDDLHRQMEQESAIAGWISRFIPIGKRFTFRTPEEFEEHARAAVLEWLPRLAGCRFHVRMRRRGFKGRLSSMAEERFLDEYLLQRLVESDAPPAKIAFDDPDAVIALETIGPQAGLSLFGRQELQRYRLLHLD